MKEDKVTSDNCPSLLIEHNVVMFIFNESVIREYPYHIKGQKETRKMLVVKKEKFEEWIKFEYEQLMEGN